MPRECRCDLREYRIDGPHVLRRCVDCHTVEIAYTSLTPAEVFELVGYLDRHPLLTYEPAGSAGRERWRFLDPQEAA